jgi:Rps23 Pro-64 3,4-dihydroxylase Tpa1-like proline 4-hydroxylase
VRNTNASTREYLEARPFPHISLDGLWGSQLDSILEEWPESFELTYDNKKELKKGTRDRVKMGPKTLAFIDMLNSKESLEWLSWMTGISDLIPDNDLRGSGLHHIDRGGFLGRHTDFTTYNGMYRRLNLLVYLNHEADKTTGGQLELLDSNKNVVRRIIPKFDRTVVFTLGTDTWHGHPEPWKGKEPRRSVALYYYTKDRGDLPEEHVPSRFL